jgi:hypothetical protein
MKKHKFQNINAGFAIFALSKNNHYADKKFSQILENINKCIDFDQIYIHYDKFKNFSGLAFFGQKYQKIPVKDYYTTDWTA